MARWNQIRDDFSQPLWVLKNFKYFWVGLGASGTSAFGTLW
jgi:hypothetical protein